MVAVAVNTMLVSVRCTKLKKDGRICEALLVKVDLDRWEEDMESDAELFCDRCHNSWRLSDYKYLHSRKA